MDRGPALTKDLELESTLPVLFISSTMSIEKELKGIKKDILLAPYTTFKIGGPAKYFFVASSKQQVIKAIQQARHYNLPFFVFGEGSNLLVSDRGFDGLVIRIQNSKIKKKDSEIIADAGARLNQLLAVAKNSELSGIEWAAGIPGTVGGAIRGNSGAFGKSISDIIKRVEVLNVDSGDIKNYTEKECLFGYRDSIFKENKNLIILSGEFFFQKADKKAIQEKIKRYLTYRREKQPIGFFSAGSVFKNPEGFSAGRLIEKCGLKGEVRGGAKISEKHANFIINLGKAKSEDVLYLIKLAKKEVKENFNIELEEEIEFLGF